jgi:putative nucleotidyltransferase with HDIG domain
MRRVYRPRTLSQIMKEEAEVRLNCAPLQAGTGNSTVMPDRIEMLDRYIGQVRSLPPAPVIATQLLSLFSEADRDIDRIVQLIGLDPSLTAEVLKRCNSASMGLAHPVRDMFEAVFQLGFYEVYCIVVSSVGARTVSILQAEGGLNTEDLWQHSVATAVAAATLAKRAQEIEAMGFTAGLLHDIGKLVLASLERVGYANLVRDAAATGIPLVAAEEASFSFNHADLGARLLERWNLPVNVYEAVRHHHACENAEGPTQPLPAIVGLANDLAHQILAETEDDAVLSDSATEALGFLHLTEADVAALRSETRHALQQVEALLHLPV